MNQPSIDFIKELGIYDEAFGVLTNTETAEVLHARIETFLNDLQTKDPDAIRPWSRVMTDIVQSKEKVARQTEKIRKLAVLYPVSSAEYEEITSDRDRARKKRHLDRFVGERMRGIRGILAAGGNLEKRVQTLSSPDDMLEMRKDLYVDRRNIAEALSLFLLEDHDLNKTMRAFFEKEMPGETEQEITALPEQEGEAGVFAHALMRMLDTLLSIERFQEIGLSSMRRLDDIDRRIVYLLTSHSSRTYRP